MRTKKLLFALLALVVSLPVVANQEFTYTDPNGVVWTYEFVDETDPSQGIVITSSVSTTDGLVLPLEINDGETTLPVIGISLILEEGITSIPDDFFKDNDKLTSVTIPNTVTSIGERAFMNCWYLASVTIPESVLSIGNAAFSNCESLSSVTIPTSVTNIGRSAFSGCRGLISVTIPTSLNEDYVFSGCSSLTSVTILESVTSIGTESFESCISLTSISIPSSVIHIGSSIFNGCI